MSFIESSIVSIPTARPRVFFTPVAPSGRVFVELNRMASLKCVVDVAASYPPVTNLQGMYNRILDHYMQHDL